MRILFAFLFASLTATAALAAPMSDAQVKQAVIQESIASYPGRCPCPYNTDRRGHRCGARSAYSKPGGYSPICYPQQVTPEMVRRYRATHGN